MIHVKPTAVGTLISQERASRHPLKIASPVVVVWTVKATSGERPLQPSKDRFMPDMHAKGHCALRPSPPK